MQQQLEKFTVAHLRDANTMLHELDKPAPSINFSKPSEIIDIIIVTFSDAIHLSENDTYRQSGIITGLKIDCSNKSLFHSIIWSSHKKRTVSYSSFGTEILPAADGDDLCYMLK